LTNEHPDAASFDQTHDMTIHRMPLSSPEWGVKSFTGLKFYYKVLRKVLDICKKSRPNKILCGRCIPEGFVGYLVNRLRGTEYICFIHGEDIETAKESRELSWIVKCALKRAKILICNSNNTANILRHTWHVEQDKIKVIHPGVDTNYFVPAPYDIDQRNALGWGERPVILTVGRLQKRKGHDKVIQALPEILKTHPRLLYCIIGQGEELDALKKLAAELGVSDSVQFKVNANDTDLLSAYQQCTVFILASRTEGNDIEGFGMVLAEAQACGKFVIAGDSGGTNEAMLPDITGHLIDASSTLEITRAVHVSLSTQNYNAQDCRDFVTEKLDWSVHIKRLSVVVN
jgi:phosphatidylinositol alpha-1,6-mannosyltransferase